MLQVYMISKYPDEEVLQCCMDGSFDTIDSLLNKQLSERAVEGIHSFMTWLDSIDYISSLLEPLVIESRSSTSSLAWTIAPQQYDDMALYKISSGQ